MEKIIDNSVELKLCNSSAIKSLVYEKEISKIIKDCGWFIYDNPYYVDRKTKKHRELDVFARQLYSRKDVKLSIDLNLIIECKSLNGFHIVFSNKGRFISSEDDTFWIGHKLTNDPKRAKKILSPSLSSPQQKGLDKILHDRFYSKDIWKFSDYTIPFFQGLDSFYSFRETNIGNTKELDSSVVWKAFMELKSINKSIQQRVIKNFREDLNYHLEGIKKVTKQKNDVLFSKIERYFEMIDFIHPILVVDCNLWELTEEEKITQIKYCRLIQSDLYGSTTFWIDVVSRNNFQSYAESLTKHYNSFLNDKNSKKHL